MCCAGHVCGDYFMAAWLPSVNSENHMQIEYAKVSALGDRTDNQDRAAVVVANNAALMMVFDGMGGHSDGAAAGV